MKRNNKTVAFELLAGEFAIIRKDIFNDKEISLDAKGLFCMIIYLLNAKLINKELDIEEIATFTIENIDETKKVYNELIEHGYIISV